MLFNSADIVFNLYAAVDPRKKAEDEGSDTVSVSRGFLQAAEEEERWAQLIKHSSHSIVF